MCWAIGWQTKERERGADIPQSDIDILHESLTIFKCPADKRPSVVIVADSLLLVMVIDSALQSSAIPRTSRRRAR